MNTKDNLKEIKESLKLKFKYCPKCNSKLEIEVDKIQGVIFIECSGLWCNGIFVVLKLNGEVIEHRFFQDNKYYCGGCGKEIKSCNCNYDYIR